MYDFVKKWTNIPQLQKSLDTAVDVYINQFPKEFRKLVIKILNDVDFFDALAFKNIVDSYKEKLKTLTKNNSKIISLINNEYSHNSDVFLGLLKGEIQISKIFGVDESLINDINKGIDFIIVDDYSGSLVSLEKFLNKMHDDISSYLDSLSRQKINILFVPIFITSIAKNNFDLIKSKYSLFNIDLVCINRLRAAKYVSSGLYLSRTEQKNFFELSNLIGINEKFVCGFNNVEDVIVFNHFVPNDTLGFIWWKNNKLYSPLFQRDYGYVDNTMERTVPSKEWEFFKTLVVRKCNSKYSLFVILLLCEYSEIDIERNIKISRKRYNSYLKRSIENDIVIYSDGKYIKSKNINNHIYYARLESYIIEGIMLKPEDEISSRLIKAKLF